MKSSTGTAFRCTLRIFPVLFLLVLALPARAQTDESVAEVPEERLKPLQFVLRGGLAFDNFYGDNRNDYAREKLKTPVAGFGINWLLDDHYRSQIYFAPEILYHRRGLERRSFDILDDPRPNDTSFTYLEQEFIHQIQLTALFKIALGAEKLKPYASLGPYLGINAAGIRRFTDVVITYDTLRNEAGEPVFDDQGFVQSDPKSTETVRDEDLPTLNTVQAGVIFAAGIDIPIKNSIGIFIEGRFQLGATRLFKDEPDLNGRLRNVRTQSLSLNLGVRF